MKAKIKANAIAITQYYRHNMLNIKNVYIENMLWAHWGKAKEENFHVYLFADVCGHCSVFFTFFVCSHAEEEGKTLYIFYIVMQTLKFMI